MGRGVPRVSQETHQKTWWPSNHTEIRVPFLGTVTLKGNLEPKRSGKGVPLGYQEHKEGKQRTSPGCERTLYQIYEPIFWALEALEFRVWGLEFRV